MTYKYGDCALINHVLSTLVCPSSSLGLLGTSSYGDSVYKQGTANERKLCTCTFI